MPRNIRWDESVNENTLCLVEALLLHADDEFKDEELKTAVDVEWVTENKLRVTGKKVKQTNGKKSRTDEVGTKKEHLLKLLKKAGKSLKLPKLKDEASISPQNRELDEIQTALDCLKELGVREDEKSAKNQGYWKFTLTLEHQSKREENLKLVKQKWKEHPKTNLPLPESGQSETLIAPENLPRSGVVEFVGRKEELERLHALLQQGSQVAICAIAGMGGVGKTELAIQYCLLHLQLHSYPGGICWLRARDSDIGLQIIEFARTDWRLHPPEDLELQQRVRWCWQHWQQGKTLVVLDDVNNYSHIQPYLPPQTSQFKVLITTRLKLDLANSLFLEVLSETDALLLLAQLIGEEKQNQELAQAKELCKRLGYLPLALQLVGWYVKKHKISLAELLRRLEKKGLAHASLVVKENDPTWTLNVQGGVAAAFKLSWEELSITAQELGCLLSLFALAPIPWLLVESAAPELDQEELEDARVELENLHLLVGEDIYQLHELIREFLKNKQNNLACADEQKDNFCKALVKVAQDIPPSPTVELITRVKNAIPHLTEVAQNLTDAVSDENLIWVFVGLDRFYCGQGLYALAEPWDKQCVSVVQTRLGEEHPDVASSYHNLAQLYYLQGRYSEAEPLHQQALEMRQKLLTEEHPDVAESLNSLAFVYDSQGRYSEAEPLYEQALEIRQKLLTGEHPDVAESLNNLAAFHDSQGRYNEAVPLYEQALTLWRHLLGEEHPNVALSLNNLAVVYRKQERYSEAEPLYHQALEMRRRLLGEEHPDVAQSLNNLAAFYHFQGHYSQAEPLFKESLEMRRRLLGEEHFDVAESLNNLASCYKKQELYSEAESLYQQALLQWRLLGEEHPWFTFTLNNLANLYRLQGLYSKAKPLFEQVLKIYEQQLGVDHPDTISVRNSLESLREPPS